MDDTIHPAMDERPARRERVGGHAWVRTAGLVGGGLVAGAILAGTVTATAATDEGATSAPSVTQEDGGTAGTAPEDCPEGVGGASGMRGTPGTTDDGATTEGDAGTEGTWSSSDPAV